MIDWNKTTTILGYDQSTIPYRKPIIIICDRCQREYKRAYRGKNKIGPHYCRKCTAANPTYRDKLSNQAKKLWGNDEYRSKVINKLKSPEVKAKLFENYNNTLGKNNLEISTKRKEAIKKLWESDEYRLQIKTSSKEMWNNKALVNKMLASRRTKAYRLNQSEKSKKRWQDSEYISKQAKSATNRSSERLAEIRANQQKVSSLQEILYSLLDDLGVKYYREYNDKTDDKECTIGPYSFDCVIPRDNQPDLLIECQGEYWHNIRKTHDERKASYISNNFSNTYELKYLWEHEFFNRNKILTLLRQWLGIDSVQLIEFDFNDIVLKKCPASEYKLLLSKYHYLPNAGHGGAAYGAYLNNKLIAVCIISRLLRQNISIDDYNNLRELSRLCIHPTYQKKNFASWFISRVIKQLPTDIDGLISYADTTFGHNGSVYQAANFKLDSIVRPDYWYINNDGWVMHKKTLYNHAIKMNMKEVDYAIEMGYTKIWGKEKLRFILDRRKHQF